VSLGIGVEPFYKTIIIEKEEDRSGSRS